MSDEKTISLDEYERDNLLWLVRCAGRLHLNTGDWVYMVRAKLEAIGGNPDNANWPPSMTEAHVQGINDMRTALATATTERDALGGEVERLRLAADMLREIPRAALSADKVYREDWEELFTDEDGAALYLDTAVDRVLDRITRKESK